MNGDIPVLMVEGNNLAEAWEKSLVSVYENGCEIKTEYDKPDDPESKDCSMTVVVRDPLSEPMIHKDLPGGLEDLQDDLDVFLAEYNTQRTNQGKRCQGRTPMQTFIDGKEVVEEKRIA